MFTQVRNLEQDELAFKILMPRQDPKTVCTNDLGDGELCGMRLCDTAGIEGPVCGSCYILYRFVDYEAQARIGEAK